MRTITGWGWSPSILSTLAPLSAAVIILLCGCPPGPGVPVDAAVDLASVTDLAASPRDLAVLHDLALPPPDLSAVAESRAAAGSHGAGQSRARAPISAPAADLGGTCIPIFNRVGAVFMNGDGSPVVADFNRDGKLDVAALQGNTIAVAPGNGDGTFGKPVDTAVNGALAIEVADWNGDRIPDLLVSFSGATAQAFIGDGTGAFKAAGKLATTEVCRRATWQATSTTTVSRT